MRAFAAVAIIAGVASAGGHDGTGDPHSEDHSAMPVMPMDDGMGGMDWMMDQKERIKVVQDLIGVFCGGS